LRFKTVIVKKKPVERIPAKVLTNVIEQKKTQQLQELKIKASTFPLPSYTTSETLAENTRYVPTISNTFHKGT
jgi:hypothetical protein